MKDIRKRNKQSIRFVVRIDSESTHGFQVRIPINGKQVSKFFSDRPHGGSIRCKAAAIKYRDRECRRLKIRFHEKRIIHSRDRRNSTGRVGVSECWRGTQKYQYQYFTASCSPGPNQPQQRKSFSANKYGAKKALALAIAWREKMEKEIMRG